MSNNQIISTAALNRIVTAQKGQGFGKWHLNFSKAQAREEGLTPKQIADAYEAFEQNHGTGITKAEMVEAVYAAIVG